MVFFLNSKVKTHTEDALPYIFDENKEKIVILGYSIVSRRSPLQCHFQTQPTDGESSKDPASSTEDLIRIFQKEQEVREEPR